MEVAVSTPCVSVIVPVYSGREYFGEFLACLQAQTLRNLEIIFIDDCGTDGTFALAQQAAEQDSRIRLIRNSRNMGPGVSRNRGIAAARGEYLAFADADDILPSDFYERLYSTARETGALVVKCGRANRYRDGGVVPSTLNASIKEALARGEHVVNAFEWEHTTAIYHREHVWRNGAQNSDARQDEDTTFIMEAVHNLQPHQFALVEDVFYYYRMHEQSVTKTLDFAYLTESIKSMNDKLDYILRQESSPQLERYAARIIDNRVNWRFKHVRNSGAITYAHRKEYLQMVLDAIAHYRQRRPLPELFDPALSLANGALSVDAYIRQIVPAVRSRFRLRLDFWRYLILAGITRGKVRDKYKAKRNAVKGQLRGMR